MEIWAVNVIDDNGAAKMGQDAAPTQTPPAVWTPPLFMPPVAWAAALVQGRISSICRNAPYARQTYMNRAYVKGPNRVQALIIPVIQGARGEAMREARISYAEDWPRLFRYTLQVAYGNSAYYLYYRDAVEEALAARYERLVDLNDRLLALCCQALGQPMPPDLPDCPKMAEDAFQFADALVRPRARGSVAFHAPSYFQAFEPFSPNLSCFDLIFNMGPEAAGILRSASWKYTSGA